MKDIYESLRGRLDDLATGYPVTESGVEIQILRRIFTEEEAAVFIKLSQIPESPEDVAKRLGTQVEEIEPILERMAKKGLLFRSRKGDSVRYSAVPYVVGIFEFQLNRLDREMAREMDDYFETGLGDTFQAFRTPVMRTIPIRRSLASQWPIAPYEDAIEIIESHETLAIVPCVCRTVKNLIGEGCGKPLETCFMFGSHGHYYVENQMGRYISKEEAREVVKRNEEAGLVMQPFNSQRVSGMCSCCGDCCAMLRSLKRQPKPAASVQSNYFAALEEDLCAGCEICLDRCQMEAIVIQDHVATINLDRCIGCGLCVTTCSTGALQLMKKPVAAQYQPPRSGSETYLRIAMERGKHLTSK